MSRYRFTGYTSSEELHNQVKRHVESDDTPYESVSEYVVRLVREDLASEEADDVAAELNIERRIEQKIDDLERTAREAVHEAIDEALDENENPDADTGSGTVPDGEDSASTEPDNDQESGQSQIQWADRDDGGDWR